MSQLVAKLTVPAAMAGAAALTLSFAPAAHGQIHVTKDIQPAIAFTVFEHQQHSDEFSCWPATCLDRMGAGPPIDDMLNGQVTVGFSHFYDLGSGWGPCHCSAWSWVMARATVLFRTEDIPPHFTKATLVLTAKAFQAAPSLSIPIGRISETAIPPKVLDGVSGNVQFNPTNGQITATYDNGDATLFSFEDVMSPDKPLAGAFPFPLPPYPTGGMIAQTPPFDFRINVTAAVSSWFSNWATRNDIPFHGFTLVGTDETMPEDDTTSLQITYAVTLQFDVDEPDR